jgi:hypothetical protein
LVRVKFWRGGLSVSGCGWRERQLSVSVLLFSLSALLPTQPITHMAQG